jgi:hypothetical protein
VSLSCLHPASLSLSRASPAPFGLASNRFKQTCGLNNYALLCIAQYFTHASIGLLKIPRSMRIIPVSNMNIVRCAPAPNSRCPFWNRSMLIAFEKGHCTDLSLLPFLALDKQAFDGRCVSLLRFSWRRPRRASSSPASLCTN